ncbi:MAG: 3-oxoacyl-[acyl-carrier-protein] synthase III C-terminal domain-containing protein [Desulfitobacteriaceae bacterium]|nr:3-oxoacyl-[acyl-carrier-protein] synthase III C-terminal domain-containing protein [Desulfitobacteriaceae bacterium]MDI6879748.1 3-oxoacyl-[acyl-carrier-protein] synthase III C-terminal domain-containing protein [Desulfitobacteriaceae bacterium]MDI6914834.1 3-oxoacyl-[acyl-carrier-protein] synthase III C-terminal domain-containing protein [Desulfitobacteriaceae bacterium]
MVGIVAYGGYIPWSRLERRSIKEAQGEPGLPGAKAVANYDEDTLTMAVAAALDCASGLGPARFDGVYFASTTSPFGEKLVAPTLAGVLDMPSGCRTLDILGSLRVGSSALLAALDAARQGKQMLVAVSDSRMGRVGGLNELLFGDGAAAFLLGDQNVIAEILDYESMSVDFYDNWRLAESRFVDTWEERFWYSQGYGRFPLEVGKKAMQKTGLKAEDFAKVVIYGMKAKDHLSLAAKAGFSPEQVADNLIDTIGNTGSACGPLALIRVLETAKPGDKVLWITYGDGSDAIVLQVTEAIHDLPPRRGVGGYLQGPVHPITYGKYLRWRNLLPWEAPRRPPLVRPSIPDRTRNLGKILALRGSRCRVCKTPHFPSQRVCVHCQAIDQMEEYSFKGRGARLVTYTLDGLAFSPDPPVALTVIDFEGGGRLVCQATDYEADELSIGLELDMTFRRLFAAEGLPVYFWKTIPKRRSRNLTSGV